MSTPNASRRLAALSLTIAAVASGCAFAPTPRDAAPQDAAPASSPPSATVTPTPKSSSASKSSNEGGGGKQVGKASFYADKFAGRKMADGTPMDPKDNNAAHKTLPLGSTAKVTNLETGRSAVVTIQDRGPFVKGRIVDLSPATAKEIGLSKEDGVAKVEVTPLSTPPAEGTKAGGPAR
ncbi:septal ring lytic transglycosylase RlpA family protein [Variovorax sp. KK3]|uniref:septal ring lytic transglycosylase RlpA family protein n=1 Tax=Variovorax sp. KK3 TaxID=1855728 RepID=UPI0009F89571|nr:septal ring lytic transglycosylase RlpA family protein [Variovorax sp. KK3]